MLDQRDDGVGPALAIIDCEIVAVDPQKMPERFKSGSLIALFERMGASDAGHKHDSEDKNVLLAETEEVPRACQGAFQQTNVADEVPLARCFDFKPIVFDHRLNWKPVRFI
jgi:hypothetical protein